MPGWVEEEEKGGQKEEMSQEMVLGEDHLWSLPRGTPKIPPDLQTKQDVTRLSAFNP